MPNALAVDGSKQVSQTHLHGSFLQPLKAHMLVQLGMAVPQPLSELLLQTALLCNTVTQPSSQCAALSQLVLCNAWAESALKQQQWGQFS